MEVYSREERVKYLDVDKNNKLTNKAIINYMQDIAICHADSLGNGLNNEAETHTAWLLLNWKIKVFDRPKCEDKLRVNTWPRIMEKCTSWRDFEIYNEDKLVAIATSKWILVNVENQRIMRITPELKEKYGTNEKSVFNKEDIVEKLVEPDGLKLAYEDIIGRTKIDTNNHLNNLYYLDYAIESLPEEVYENNTFNNIEIMYKKEIKYKDKVKCLYKCEKNEHVVVIKSEDLNTLHAIIKLS